MRTAIAALLCAAMAAAGAWAQTVPPPPPLLKATHGAWEVLCYGEDDCIMTQMHRRTDETADAVVTLFKPRDFLDDAGQPIPALVEIVVPLGVFLPGALGLQIDGNGPLAVPFERCIPDGCIVRAPIAREMLDQMRAGATAYLILSPSPENRVRLPISLTGFSAAFDSL